MINVSHIYVAGDHFTFGFVFFLFRAQLVANKSHESFPIEGFHRCFTVSFCEDCCYSSSFSFHPLRCQLVMCFLYKLSSNYTIPHMILATSFSCGVFCFVVSKHENLYLWSISHDLKILTVSLFCKCIHIFFSQQKENHCKQEVYLKLLTDYPLPLFQWQTLSEHLTFKLLCKD